MSIEAVSWVFKLEIARSSEKFVMVCLANYADERGICYPSVQTICLDTGLDRKTVISSLKRLCENGLLRDTGQRIGRTSAVPVYQLVGMPSASIVHYVYRVTTLETGEFYIGRRSFDGDPEKDIYCGRSKWVMDMLAKGISLHREVLNLFDNEHDAQVSELDRFKEFSNNPLFRNELVPRGGARGAARRDWNRADFVEATHRSDSNTTAQNGAVFSGSGTVISKSSTVFPSKQYQKRDTEPSLEPLKNISKPSKDSPVISPPQDKPALPKKKSKANPATPVAVVLPDWLPQSTWDMWVSHRNKIKASLTQDAANLCVKRLAELRTEGHDPVAVIEASVMSGKWPGLYPLKVDQQQGANGDNNATRPEKFNPSAYVSSAAYRLRWNAAKAKEEAAARAMEAAARAPNIIEVDSKVIDIECAEHSEGMKPIVGNEAYFWPAPPRQVDNWLF